MLCTFEINSGSGGGAVSHVYTDDEGILDGDLVLVETFEDGEIQQGDVSLGIGPALAGALDRAELPATSVPGENGGGYRARLTRTIDDVDEVVLDGLVPYVDAALDTGTEDWSVQLVAAASEDFWARLEAVRLLDLPEPVYAALTYAELPYHYRETTTVRGNVSSRYFHSLGIAPHGGLGKYRWYDLTNLLFLVLTEAAEGITRDGPFPPWAYTVRTSGGLGGGDNVLTRAVFPVIFSFDGYTSGAYSRTNLTLPAWTGKDLLEKVLAQTGWTLVVRYAEYPSSDLVVTFLPAGQALPDPAGLPELDERVAEAAYTRKGEPGLSGGFAVQHASALRATTPPVKMPIGLLPGSYTGHGTLPVPPPTTAVLAQRPWQFSLPKGRDGAPEPTAETKEETGWNLPLLGHPDPEGLQLSYFDHTPQLGVPERVWYGIPVVEPAVGGVYLGSLVVVGGAPFLVYGRESRADGRPADQPVMTFDVGAGPAYAARGASNVPVEVATGGFYTHGLDLQVGVPAGGASLEGESWLVVERRVKLTDDDTALVLHRPAREGSPAAEIPPKVGLVQELRVRYEFTQEFSDGVSRFLIATWEPPTLAQAQFVRYEFEWRDTAGGWGINAVLTCFATAQILTGPVDGKTYQVRVRVVGETGPGEWVTSAALKVSADTIANGTP
jgi:hypothetical protein